ncbi:MAG TPA: ABC-F family ATP-binding cassette domain-containing protein [Acidimicrobiia bacterium]|jgi:ATPase subunit of ABC transporter with duplicated ATPase domains|nr:ABC-F family ATP-binding cassette domain-containing protein [Acidimicrobiia bacterium]
MLIARDLRIEAGIRTLIEDVSFSVQARDRIGLVGRNGAGKTTLMRTLIGDLHPAEGTVLRSGNIGYFSQEAALPDLEHPDATALERILMAREIGALQRRIEHARQRLEGLSGAERDRGIARFARLHEEFEAKGGFVAEAEAKRIAANVGIGNDELVQPVKTMSGGQRRRVELARLLFAETDVILLDEPTNHLDLDAKGWLIEYLSTYKGGMLVVSHDLPLLDEAITSVLALEHGKIEAYRGNYSNYLVERDLRQERKERERRHQDEAIARLEANIRRFKGTTEKMAKVAKAMETRVDRMKRELVEVQKGGKTVRLAFPQPERSGRVPLAASGLAKSFGDNLVFLDIEFAVERGERMLLIGLNGAGKTTLLRILAGVENADLGEVSLGYETSLGYYAQEHEQIDQGSSVFDHMRGVTDLPDTTIRSLLGHFLLADKVDQDAGTLSGGEKTKLALAMLVAGRPNVLLLDEPTNNLDPQAKEALLDALTMYEGTIVMVSHDTDFVAQLMPDRAILMPEGEMRFFDASLLDLVALA